MSKEVFSVDFTPLIPAILLRKPIKAPLFFSMQRIVWKLGSRSAQINSVALSYALGAIYARYRSVFAVYWNFLVEPAPVFCHPASSWFFSIKVPGEHFRTIHSLQN